ncbi:hypothetical protein NC653_039895 [Populus alba x Populus x berolinensis]|uniref:Uncharacterized protein n=1 Tax=Populus alba x Populus x berolinensis TaxID=444605 RepID=A0AAD6PR02_9ROSI|nr:hypothetical protein NC653_039895 [Populus alba x Populus x berolinensis]
MRLTSSVKIEALSNISLAYQPLPSKQSNESWMVSRVLPRLKLLGYRYFPTYPRFSDPAQHMYIGGWAQPTGAGPSPSGSARVTGPSQDENHCRSSDSPLTFSLSLTVLCMVIGKRLGPRSNLLQIIRSPDESEILLMNRRFSC